MKTGLQMTPGYTNSFAVAINVLRSDAGHVERAGYLAKADTYRYAADELERAYQERMSLSTDRGERDDG